MSVQKACVWCCDQSETHSTETSLTVLHVEADNVPLYVAMYNNIVMILPTLSISCTSQMLSAHPTAAVQSYN